MASKPLDKVLHALYRENPEHHDLQRDRAQEQALDRLAEQRAVTTWLDHVPDTTVMKVPLAAKPRAKQ